MILCSVFALFFDFGPLVAAECYCLGKLALLPAAASNIVLWLWPCLGDKAWVLSSRGESRLFWILHICTSDLLWTSDRGLAECFSSWCWHRLHCSEIRYLVFIDPLLQLFSYVLTSELLSHTPPSTAAVKHNCDNRKVSVWWAHLLTTIF